MRLIDAEQFKKFIGNDTILKKNICRMIDEQPTAYDVEEKVRQLEELKSYTETEEFVEYMRKIGVNLWASARNLYLDKAIAVVRGE